MKTLSSLIYAVLFCYIQFGFAQNLPLEQIQRCKDWDLKTVSSIYQWNDSIFIRSVNEQFVYVRPFRCENFVKYDGSDVFFRDLVVNKRHDSLKLFKRNKLLWDCPIPKQKNLIVSAQYIINENLIIVEKIAGKAEQLSRGKMIRKRALWLVNSQCEWNIWESDAEIGLGTRSPFTYELLLRHKGMDTFTEYILLDSLNGMIKNRTKVDAPLYSIFLNGGFVGYYFDKKNLLGVFVIIGQRKIL